MKAVKERLFQVRLGDYSAGLGNWLRRVTFLYSQKAGYNTMLDIFFFVWMRTGSYPPDIDRFQISILWSLGPNKTVINTMTILLMPRQIFLSFKSSFHFKNLFSQIQKYDKTRITKSITVGHNINVCRVSELNYQNINVQESNKIVGKFDEKLIKYRIMFMDILTFQDLIIQLLRL